MGMYTQLVINTKIRDDISNEIINILAFLFNGEELNEDIIPEHKFFKCQRWELIGRCGYILSATSQYKGGYLFSKSELKNYNNEIELFIDWLKPYICEYSDEFIGYWLYEEYDKPELIFK